MIQVHGKTILSMEFKSIIKAHGLNPWQFIYPKPSSRWQYLKPNSHWQHQAQFSLAMSKKPSSHWQYPKLNFHWHAWQRKNIMVKYYHCKENHGNCLIRKNSLGVILRIMFSYYKPMKYMDIICITTSIIYTFSTHGKTFEPTSSSFKLQCDY